MGTGRASLVRTGYFSAGKASLWFILTDLEGFPGGAWGARRMTETVYYRGRTVVLRKKKSGNLFLERLGALV